MSDRLVNVDDVAWIDHEHGDHTFRRKQLGSEAGGEALGTSLHEVPPGKRTWLRHYHTGNEEALFVLDGGGTLALGPDAEEHDLEPGDYVALPANEEGTHAVRAGEDGLRYLAISTMNEPEIIVYPDDGKAGLYAGSAPGGPADERTISTYLDLDADVPYWDDEE